MTHYRRLQRHMNELIGEQPRSKRSIQTESDGKRYKRNYHSASSRLFGVHKRQRYLTVRRNNHNDANSHRRVSRTLSDVIYRQMRQPFQGDEAYAKYMAKIKQRYQKYVKNILGHNKNLSLNTNRKSSSLMVGENSQDKKNQINELFPSDYMETPTFLNPVSFHQPRAKPHSNQNKLINETIAPLAFSPNNNYQIINNNYLHMGALPAAHNSKLNVTDIMAKLNAQLIRRKRSTVDVTEKSEPKRKRTTPDDDVRDSLSANGQRTIGRKGGRRNLNATTLSTSVSSSSSNNGGGDLTADADGSDSDIFKRGKPKSPCEVRG